MIVLNVTYKCKPDMRDEFLESIMAEGIDVASREEQGNIKYDYYYSTEDLDEMFLLEKWADSEALSAHQKMSHFARLGELKSEFVLDTVIEKYIIE